MKEVICMTKYREILRLCSQGLSNRDIAVSCSVSRNTVARVLQAAQRKNISWPLAQGVTNSDLEKLLFPKEKTATSKRLPNLTYIRKELDRNGVNKKLLWMEYLEECRQCGDDPLMYSQFCYYIQEDEQKRRATMHIPRRPGEQAEVDWAGDPAHIIDPDTGEMIDAWLFVGVMTYSQYTYVEAFINEQQKAWITAHNHMLEFFGGVPKIIVPDNAATAVDRKQSNWYTPTLNATYHEWAEHYNTAIIPARVRRPKDKPNAEGSVGNISTWITAALRNEQFFSLSELNAAVKVRLKAFNAKPFQKKEGSRLSLFLGEEKPLLAPLPATSYELATFKQATVQFNYHIAVDKMYYSVPYQYIRNRVDVRITDTTVEIFIGHERIASHRRLYGRPGQYSTVTEHMPPDHQKFLEWNGDRFREWAKRIGSNTYGVVNGLLTSTRVEQQNYRACMGLLKLADRHSPQKLEAACEKALRFSNSPSYKSIQNIIANLKDENSKPSDSKTSSDQYGITRGARYYGGHRND